MTLLSLLGTMVRQGVVAFAIWGGLELYRAGKYWWAALAISAGLGLLVDMRDRD